MSDKSQIEWTEATWNPTTGCDRISPGCARCYAKAIHDRRHKAHLAGRTMPVQFHQPFEIVQTRADRLETPLHWRRPRRIFVDSMSDLFHEDVPDTFIDQVFAVMALCPQHTFQVLTKRADRMRAYMARPGKAADIAVEIFKRFSVLRDADVQSRRAVKVWPLPTVWLGVSVENQAHLYRIDHLKDVDAAVHFVSFEPLLEHLGALILDGIQWAIVGGESGPQARPCDVAWVRSVVNECRRQGVSCFVKQLGVKPTGWWSNSLGPRIGTLKDRKGGDPAEWPSDLQVRQFPEVRG